MLIKDVVGIKDEEGLRSLINKKMPGLTDGEWEIIRVRFDSCWLEPSDQLLSSSRDIVEELKTMRTVYADQPKPAKTTKPTGRSKGVPRFQGTEEDRLRRSTIRHYVEGCLLRLPNVKAFQNQLAEHYPMTIEDAGLMLSCPGNGMLYRSEAEDAGLFYPREIVSAECCGSCMLPVPDEGSKTEHEELCWLFDFGRSGQRFGTLAAEAAMEIYLAPPRSFARQIVFEPQMSCSVWELFADDTRCDKMFPPGYVREMAMVPARLFSKSTTGWCLRIASLLADACQLDVRDVVIFLLTGELSVSTLIEIDSQHANTFGLDMEFDGRGTPGTIRMTIQPWMSAEAVATMYKSYLDELRMGLDVRPIKNQELFYNVNCMMREDHDEFAQSNGRPSWAKILAQFRADEYDPGVKGRRELETAYKDVLKALFPPSRGISGGLAIEMKPHPIIGSGSDERPHD
jgi:hypothetical protein